MFLNLKNKNIEREFVLIIQNIVKFKIKTISIIGEGNSAIGFEINNDFVFLIGKNENISNSFHKQFILLPKINRYIKYQLPYPIWYSRKDSYFKFGYLGYKKIIGVNNNQRNHLLINHKTLSADVANFLFQLHSLNTNTLMLDSCNFEHEDILLRDFIMPKLKNLFSITEYKILEKWWINYFLNSQKYILCAKFIHGDFHFQNFVLSSDYKKLIGVIDFEGCGIGNPANDLASLNYISKNFLNLVLDKYSRQTGFCRNLLEEVVQLQWEKREFSNLNYSILSNSTDSVRTSIDKVRKGHLFC